MELDLKRIAQDNQMAANFVVACMVQKLNLFLTVAL